MEVGRWLRKRCVRAELGGAANHLLSRAVGLAEVVVRGLLGVGALVRYVRVGGLASAVGNVLWQEILRRLVLGM